MFVASYGQDECGCRRDTGRGCGAVVATERKAPTWGQPALQVVLAGRCEVVSRLPKASCCRFGFAAARQISGKRSEQTD